MALRNPLALLVLALIFVPLERIFALRPSPIFRRGWRTDVVHFFATHLLEQLALVTAVVTVIGLLEPLISVALQDRVASQPMWLQLGEALLLIETIGYFMHRAFHAVPWLWRIHAVHHSSEHLDWLAALRVHPLDQTLTRVAQFAPLFLLGFTKELFGGLALLLGLWAIFLHANVRVRLGWLEHVVATPHFHHWHHAGDARGNFSGLFPVFDVIFGTRTRPAGWPPRYGSDTPVPVRWHEQIVFPFRRVSAAVAAAPAEAPR